MKVAALPFPDKDSQWASNVVFGVGLGAQGFIKGFAKGVSGVVTEPYKGAREKGVQGGVGGLYKGFKGLVKKPAKGVYQLFAQPIVGLSNTPGYISKKINKKGGEQPTNFQIFGVDQVNFDEEDLKEGVISAKEGPSQFHIEEDNQVFNTAVHRETVIYRGSPEEEEKFQEFLEVQSFHFNDSGDIPLRKISFDEADMINRGSSKGLTAVDALVEQSQEF
mmetsp:Transcript_35773/g.54783  ORF Transcript_35773/g.54783 Transcript_35773/m.54783 type:complete len:220 (-) Transcript_35773:1229-1888(-)